VFSNLDDFYAKNNKYVDETIGIFDREIQFYITYLEFIEFFKQEGRIKEKQKEYMRSLVQAA